MTADAKIVDMQTRAAEVEAPAEPEERKNRRRVRMVSQEGRFVRRFGYDPDARRFGEYDEELVLSGADLSRVDTAQVSFLDTHRSGSVADVIGRVLPGSARITEDGIEAEVELDEADPRARKILDGFARNVSVGYEYQSVERIGRKDDVPLVRVTRWRLRELSAVPVGADFGAAFRCRGLFDSADPVGDTQPQQEDRSVKLTAQQALEAAKYARALGVEADKADELIQAAETMEGALRAILDVKAKEQEQTPGPSVAGRITAGADAADKGREALKARISARLGAAGMALAKGQEVDKRFADASMTQIVAAHLAGAGVSVPAHATSRQVMELAVGTRGANGPHSTSDLPNVLADVINNSIMAIEETNPSTFEQWSAPTTFSDFREQRITRLSEDEGLLEVVQGDEITTGTVGDEYESVSALKYGRKYALTLEAILNDNLSAFSQLPARFTQRWRSKRNAIAYAKLLANPTMKDGHAFFSSAHANIVASPTPAAPSTAQLEALRLLLVSQTNKKGQKVRVQPVRYLAPEALSVQFARLLGNTIQPINPIDTTSASLAVPTNLRLPVVHEIELDAAPAGYYCVGPASEMPAVFGQIAGYRLRVRTEWDYDRECFVTSVTDSFGFGLINWRAMAYNPGTT